MMMIRRQSLHRTWYATDANKESVGTFSDPFPMENAGRRIVDVDWSVPGKVQVTWLVNE
jgi:hypothetical protein